MLTPQRPRRPTIEDVAAAASVSVATVSRALRGLPNVAISTRERVTAVATELGYSADPAASRLAAGRTNTVTVVVPDLSGWYFSTVVAGIEAVCSETGLDLLVVGVGSRMDLSRILNPTYQLERRTDGLVVVDVPVTAEQAESITARGVVLTTVGNTTAGHPSIRIDNVQVGRLAADHLADLGHRRLALIGGQKDDPMAFEVPTQRFAGFVDALKRRNLEFDHDLVEGGNFGLDGGQEAMAKLLDRADPPTAVFAMSDEMAFGAIVELENRGRRVGAARDAVSVIGVDDHEFSRVVGLTTIHQPVADHGAAAARLLLTAMGRDTPDTADVAATGPTSADSVALDTSSATVIAPVRLIVRTSTAAL